MQQVAEQQIVSGKIAAGTGVVAAGAGSTPTELYAQIPKMGNSLTTQEALLGLSWSEVIQILSAIYVFALLVKMAIPGVKWVYNAIKR